MAKIRCVYVCQVKIVVCVMINASGCCIGIFWGFLIQTHDCTRATAKLAADLVNRFCGLIKSI
jgi:hypothetical protein